jgi:hypothetical protein
MVDPVENAVHELTIKAEDAHISLRLEKSPGNDG